MAKSVGKKYKRGQVPLELAAPRSSGLATTSRARLLTGQAALEMLVALAVLVFAVSASIMVAFSNQSYTVDTETNNEAVTLAREQLDAARVAVAGSFNSLVTTSSAQSFYSINLQVADITECVKDVTSSVTWNSGSLRPQGVNLSTVFTDVAGAIALGGDCEINPPGGGWTNPNTLMSRDLNYKASYNDNPLVNSAAGTPATDMDVLNKTIYMTAMSNKDNFFILDGTGIINGIMPPIVGSLNIGPGLNSVDVARDNNTGKIYAYVVQNDNQKQLQVIDVSTDPANPMVIASTTLPNITFTCSKPCLAGQSVFYYDGRVYVGTKYIANLALPSTKNNEFHVFCVRPEPAFPMCDTSSPANPIWMGSVNVNHNVNAIAVRGDYAYLATSNDSGEIMVYNVGNPANIQLVGSFDAQRSASDDEDATSIFIVGNRLYFGRQIVNSTSERDFYILDISNPTTPVELCATCSINLGSSISKNISGSTVTGTRVSGNYAFLSLDDSNIGFLTLDISNPAAIKPIGPYNFSNHTTGLDLEDNFIYSSNNQNDGLRIIRPAQCADKIDDDGDGKIDAADPQCHTDGNPNNSASYNPEDDNEAS
ncbi:MAG: hypothetical protein KGJ89_02815 [Patescibacteria group bacterium]|nr:hypothetical protein [Patescibacteria group bacterium]MDE2015518.1 hypothetical protein [Patescibacteria group bacterium]MDE2226866.1 hypothetical protein [Patescibacteria group bacterium]